MDYLTVN